MLDFLLINGTGQHTSLKLVLFTFVLTIILSLILVLTYEKTSRQVSKPDHFIQSLILMSLVTATIMQSIGDSLALSFGIFGALAMIRFRTNVSDPRDIAFIFASMAVGIACGVHSFLNGIIGTLIFCLLVILIRFSPFGQKTNMIGDLRVQLPYDVDKNFLLNAVEKFKTDYSIKRTRYVLLETGKNIEYEFRIKLSNPDDYRKLIDEINKIENATLVRFNFDDENNIEIT